MRSWDLVHAHGNEHPLLFVLIDKQYYNYISLKWEAGNFIQFKIPFFFYVFRDVMDSHMSVTSPAAPYT